MNLRLPMAIIIAVLASHAIPSEPATSRLEVVLAEGQTIPHDEASDLMIKFWLQQLVLSGLYRNVVLDSTSEDWSKAQEARPRIHCIYPADSHIALPERPMLTFDEILVPVPERGYADFVYLRSGTKYFRVAKYNPWVFQKLRLESGISGEMDPNVPRSLF